MPVNPSPYADAARETAAALAADFVDAPPAEPVSPFRPRRAQDPRPRPNIQPNDAMARGGEAFDEAFNNAVSTPGLLRRRPTYTMSEAEYVAYRDRVFGESVEAPAAEAGRPAGRLQALSDDQIAALQAKLRAEEDRRAVAEYAATVAAGEAEVDDLSDLADADDVPYGDGFAYTDAAEFDYLAEGDETA